MSLRRRLLTLVKLVPVALVLPLGAAAEAGAAESSPRAARAAAVACPAATVTPDRASRPVVVDATFCLINRERARRGLPRLREDARLARSAQQYSTEMAGRDFFGHVSPAGTTLTARLRAAGYLAGARAYTVGENIAWGAGPDATAHETVQGWMRSPGHRANILGRGFREVGVGVAPGAPVTLRAAVPAATYTTVFGARN
jgi:uncharacterized protein YkwD